MALTAVPAYFLARRLLSHGWSLSVARSRCSIPATCYSALVMTESLFYPGFVTTSRSCSRSRSSDRPPLASCSRCRRRRARRGAYAGARARAGVAHRVVIESLERAARAGRPALGALSLACGAAGSSGVSQPPAAVRRATGAYGDARAVYTLSTSSSGRPGTSPARRLSLGSSPFGAFLVAIDAPAAPRARRPPSGLRRRPPPASDALDARLRRGAVGQPVRARDPPLSEASSS